MIMTIEKVQKEVETFRKAWGQDIVTDVRINGDIASYTFMPHNSDGYRQEYLLGTDLERHCGLGQGCFWTDWE